MKKRTLLITGGSRGIGRAIIKRLSSECNIVAPTRAELDLNSAASIQAFCERIKKTKIDILVNNAGVNYPQWIDETTDDVIYETMQINLIAPILLCRAVVPYMKKQTWGRIVNMSSAFGIVARGKQVLYSATKHGINGVTKALALELAEYNILVNSVCPGFARTDLVIARNSKEKVTMLEANIPIRRLVEPQEIAELIAFVISEKNTYITGQDIVIDGGFTAQ